jgi:acyl dehydratase
VADYGNLIGDNNLLHRPLNWEETLAEMPVLSAHRDAGLIQLEGDGKTTKILVHGMLVSSLFSSIFAALAPGSVYLNQTLDFRSPAYADDPLIGRVEVDRVRKWRRGGVVLQCATSVSSLDRPIVTGTANVWLPSGFAPDTS